MKLFVPAAACALALSLVPSLALAQSDADRATARALAGEGQDALDKKDYARAADRFGRADSLIHAPTLLIGLARANVGLGKWVAAQEAYSRILREGAGPSPSASFARALEDARKELDVLEPRLPGIVINVQGSDAPKVTLDGVAVPAAALGVRRPADPGKHVVIATADGFTTEQKTVSLVEKGVETVTLTIAKGSSSAVAAAPAAAAPAGSAAPPDAPPPAKSTQRTAGFVALGVGAAGLGLGLVTGGLALGKHGDLVKECPSGKCDFGNATVKGDYDSFQLMGTLSTVGFITAVVGGGAGVALLLTAPKPPPTTGWVRPVVGIGYAGAEGKF